MFIPDATILSPHEDVRKALSNRLRKRPRYLRGNSLGERSFLDVDGQIYVFESSGQGYVAVSQARCERMYHYSSQGIP